jgi:DNA-binding LacI/PurR family transcriptional regulator
MGSAAVELLVERIASPNRRTRHITLDVTLVERESVGTLEQVGRARRPKERLHIGV